MSSKTKFWILAVIAAAVAVVVAVLLLKKGDAPVAEPEEPTYDRTASPEYKKLMDFEKAEQKRTMGEIARARQNLEEAREAGLETEVLKELEDAVAAGERQLERERARMRDNVRREIWKEMHPEHIKVLEENTAKEREIMAQLDAAKKRLDDAVAAGAGADETAALKQDVDALVAKLIENHQAADAALRKLSK